MTKQTNPVKGTRDFLAAEVRKRDLIRDTIRKVFDRYRFLPMDTPAIERLDILQGKPGQENEKLMFKILARGEDGKNGIADLGLRYDLTVPLARVIANNPNLQLPFKRWQMAPVWRADRPQHGRYREFWQCDADIVGADSRVADAECLTVAHDVFQALGLEDIRIRVNDRRVLKSIVRLAGCKLGDEQAVITLLDKLDKVSRSDVESMLAPYSIDTQRLWEVLDTRDFRSLDEEGQAGLTSVREILSLIGRSAPNIEFDPVLARGLDYYTGTVYEFVLPNSGMGSLGGGGRYDNLVGVFANKQIPCVGVSFGLDRIQVVMEERGLLSPEPTHKGAVFVTVWDSSCTQDSFAVAQDLRKQGFHVDVCTKTSSRLVAQLKYAVEQGFEWAVIRGPNEVTDGNVALKHLTTKNQRVIPLVDLMKTLKQGA